MLKQIKKQETNMLGNAAVQALQSLAAQYGVEVQYRGDIERNANIPFTSDNIKGTLENILLNRKKLFETSVANVFDELTKFYAGNSTGTGGGGDYTGWKTNDNFKVNQKLVFPYGCNFDKDMGSWRMWYSQSSVDIYNDVDRILCVLEGRDFEKCYTIYDAMNAAFNRLERMRKPFGTSGSRALWSQSDQVAESEYFHIRFYQKGTVHLKWKRLDLWELFNKTAAAGRMWLGMNTKGTPEDKTPDPEPSPDWTPAPGDRVLIDLPTGKKPGKIAEVHDDGMVEVHTKIQLPDGRTLTGVHNIAPADGDLEQEPEEEAGEEAAYAADESQLGLWA